MVAITMTSEQWIGSLSLLGYAEGTKEREVSRALLIHIAETANVDLMEQTMTVEFPSEDDERYQMVLHINNLFSS